MTVDALSRTEGVLDVAGLKLEIRSWPGTGGPLVLLHEGLGSVGMWRDFPDRLATQTGRPVIAWSRQGYGWSEPLLTVRGPGYMHVEAKRVPIILDALGIERAVLIGHSDGGSIALIAASLFPERIEALILEAPHVYVEQLTVESIAAVKRVYRQSDLGTRLGHYHRDADRMFWQWNDIWLDSRFRDWNIEELLPDVRAPTLLIQGLDDEYGTLDQIDRIEARLGRTVRLELQRCGHSPHRDQPEAVLRGITTFLGGLAC